MPSVKSNIILNGINTLTGIVFPIITFPYAARVLSPDGIGAVNFLNSIIGYIVLLTSLGIPMYAVKEIAKYRDDNRQRDKIAVEIIILSTLLCLSGYIAVWALAELVPQIHRQAALFYILSLTIIFTSIGVNWFYQGIEDFKFITIRAIIIRTLAAAALFIFIRSKADLLIYGMIVVGSTVGNNFINFIHLRKHIDWGVIKLRELKIGRHLKPAVQVFILNLIISLYIQLNSVMLGFMSGDEAVGYFTAGTKITHIALTIITSLGTVLLPRCSHLLQVGNHEGFTTIIRKSLNLTLALSLPMTAGLMLLAVPITMIFCGEEYVESISILYLNAPVVIFIALTNVMGIQVLYPMNKIRIVIMSVSGGAVFNMLLNLILIPPYGAVGAAISTLIAEFVVLVTQLLCGRKYYPFEIRSLFNYKYIIATAAMAIAVYAILMTLHSHLLKLSVGLIAGMTIYFFALLLTKDPLLKEMLSIIEEKNRIWKFK